MRCPSSAATRSTLLLISKSSPVIILLFSFGAIEKIVSSMMSFSVIWETTTGMPFSMMGMSTKSSPSLPAISKCALPEVILTCRFSVTAMFTSSSGSFRTISEKILASTATRPFSATSASTVVLTAISMSLAVSVTISYFASSRKHSRIGSDVLVGTAFMAVLMAATRLFFKNVRLSMISSSFK